MVILVTLIHIIACLMLILVVLLQTGKSADLSGAFGGGGSQTAFGSRGGASLLSRSTTGAAVLFMVTSLTLSILGAGRSTTVMDDAESTLPATSAPAETPPATGDALPAVDLPEEGNAQPGTGADTGIAIESEESATEGENESEEISDPNPD